MGNAPALPAAGDAPVHPASFSTLTTATAIGQPTFTALTAQCLNDGDEKKRKKRVKNFFWQCRVNHSYQVAKCHSSTRWKNAIHLPDGKMAFIYWVAKWHSSTRWRNAICLPGGEMPFCLVFKISKIINLV